jgi:hypothetical protein
VVVVATTAVVAEEAVSKTSFPETKAEPGMKATDRKAAAAAATAEATEEAPVVSSASLYSSING